MDFSWFYSLDLKLIFLLMVLLIAGSAIAGLMIGRLTRETGIESSDIGTLAGAALGLLALLIGFSFAIALARYDGRRQAVLDEANAIEAVAHQSLMLPAATRTGVLETLEAYGQLRLGLGIPYGAAKMDRDLARSHVAVERLWSQAAAADAAAPQSLAVHRFVHAVEQLTVAQEARLTAVRYHVPAPVLAMLVGISMVAMGFTGYHSGYTGGRREVAGILMAVTIAAPILLIVDLDRPQRGLIAVPLEALADAAHNVAAIRTAEGGPAPLVTP